MERLTQQNFDIEQISSVYHDVTVTVFSDSLVKDRVRVTEYE